MCMGKDKLKEKLKEQQKVYVSLKAGNTDTVCYKEFQNGEWGTDDANYVNRLRLAYYLLYWKIKDEDAVAYLFQEELKDRENNSYQGIGSTIRILTMLLQRYNAGHKYDDLFERAKNANFDCACGYDAEDLVDDDFESNDLTDCVYLCRELEYKDVMSVLVDEWKDEGKDRADRNPAKRSRLMGFYTYLGREDENESLYQEQLAETVAEGGIKEIISAYRDIIHHYLRVEDYERAACYCRIVIQSTDYKQVRRLRLFGDILEGCMEVIAQKPAGTSDLWEWAKGELEGKPRINRYGNLYTKGIAAARAVGDPFADKLEQEYLDWRRECSLDRASV